MADARLLVHEDLVLIFHEKGGGKPGCEEGGSGILPGAADRHGWLEHQFTVIEVPEIRQDKGVKINARHDIRSLLEDGIPERIGQGAITQFRARSGTDDDRQDLRWFGYVAWMETDGIGYVVRHSEISQPVCRLQFHEGVDHRLQPACKRLLKVV